MRLFFIYFTHSKCEEKKKTPGKVVMVTREKRASLQPQLLCGFLLMRFTISWHIVSSTVSTTKWSHCPTSDLITTMLYTLRNHKCGKKCKRKEQIYKTGNKSILGVTRKDGLCFVPTVLLDYALWHSTD